MIFSFYSLSIFWTYCDPFVLFCHFIFRVWDSWGGEAECDEAIDSESKGGWRHLSSLCSWGTPNAQLLVSQFQPHFSLVPFINFFFQDTQRRGRRQGQEGRSQTRALLHYTRTHHIVFNWLLVRQKNIEGVFSTKYINELNFPSGWKHIGEWSVEMI